MCEIVLCNRTLSSKSFKNQCGLEIENFSSLSCTKPEKIIANQPYLLESDHSHIGKSALTQLFNPFISRELTNLSLSYGGDNLRLQLNYKNTILVYWAHLPVFMQTVWVVLLVQLKIIKLL